MLRVLLLLSSIFLTLSWASLKKEILSNYSRTELPPDSPIKVSLSLALYQLINFDVKTQSVFCLFWQRASWKDSRLAWRNYKIGTDKKFMHFAYKDIWMPDILPYEDIGAYDAWKYKDTILLKASPDGKVQWLAPAPMKIACSMQMTDFPYDSHTCEINITPWQYDHTEIEMGCIAAEIDMKNFKRSMEWEVTETKCTELLWKIQDDHYDAIKYTITFRRLRKFYLRLLIWPNIALLTLSSLMFFLPSGTTDRPNFALTVLLTLTVNLIIITEFVPETSRSFPRVCNYFLGSILLCAIGVLLVCLIDQAGSIVKSGDEEVQSEIYCAEGGEKVDDVSTKTTQMKKKIRLLWVKLLMIVKRKQNFIGFIYFLSTLAANTSCLLTIT